MKPVTVMEEKRHALLTDISESVAGLGLEFGLTSEAAEQLGIAVADLICEKYGGQNFVFPKDHFFKLAKRDWQIHCDSNGRNTGYLSQQYGLTEAVIRRILKRVQKSLVKRVQPDLDMFGEEE